MTGAEDRGDPPPRLGLANRGGIINPETGLGTARDKSDSGTWSASRLTKKMLEIIYVESWAAKKAIDIPVDDMFSRGRLWQDENSPEVQRLIAADEQLGATKNLVCAIKAARLYGTSMMIMVTGPEEALETPLDVETIAPGGLRSLPVIDRFSAEVKSWVLNIDDPAYGQPEVYEVVAPVQERELPERKFLVHRSRVLRFDARPPLTTAGWTEYPPEWGVSELVMAVNDLMHDASLMAAASHLAQESSMMVVKHPGLRDAADLNAFVAGTGPLDIAEMVDRLKSVYRMLFIDTESDAKRVEANFAGIPELIDRIAQRVAAIFGIPLTRFKGEPPTGFQATGESDHRNYLLMVAALATHMLASNGPILDLALARHAGLREPPIYEWPPIVDPNPKVAAEIAEIKAKTVVSLTMAGIIDENEARELLAGDSLRFNTLGPMPDGQLRRNAPVVVVPPRAPAT